MVGIAWREDLDGWLEPFLARLKHEKRRRWAPVGLHGLLGPATARACSQPRPGSALAAMTSFITSSPASPGTTPLCDRYWSRKRTPWSAARMRCW